MAQESFAFLYVVSAGTPPGVLTVGSPISFLNFAQESGLDADGINGSTAIGQIITFAGASSRFLGLTADGEPIAAYNQVSPPYTNIQIASNNPSLGPSVDSSGSGPYLFCFAAGTSIETSNGRKNVERLEISDHVTTAKGRTVPVKWIGRQTVHTLFSGPHMQPVRIRAGALGEGLPETDLTVTADHGMIIDTLVIDAAALVNGTNIDFVPLAELPDRVTFYHIETENHDVILANGTPAETFVDVVTRANFDNYAEYLDLYGTERLIPEMHRPRISSQRLLPKSIKVRLGIKDCALYSGQLLRA